MPTYHPTFLAYADSAAGSVRAEGIRATRAADLAKVISTYGYAPICVHPAASFGGIL